MKKENLLETNLINENIIEEQNLYQTKYSSFYNNLNNYMLNFILPNAIAFYLASSFEYNCLGNHPINNHFNSALELFNVHCDIKEIRPLIDQILLINYHLQIVSENPLILEKNL